MSIARFNKWQNTSGNTVNTVVQVATVYNQDRQSVYSDNLAAIPNLSLSFTPMFATSKILIMAMLNGNSQHVTTYGILRNGTPVGGAGNNNTNVTAGSLLTVYYGQDVASNMYGQHLQYLDTAGTTSAITYAAAVSASWGGTIRTAYINDRDTNDMRSGSSLIVMEILQ
jgi:hypothetical protein